jgi:hypothetical protein
VELAALIRAQVAQRRVADDLPDAAAQVSARHWESLDRTGYQAAMLSLWSDCWALLSGRLLGVYE